jgi:hypothetical protein
VVLSVKSATPLGTTIAVRVLAGIEISLVASIFVALLVKLI